jgi:nitroreductase
MDLLDALRTTGAVRQFTDEDVDDATLRRILDTARFAPSGGNQQAWRVAVLRSPEVRAAVREAFLAGWHEYLAMGAAGLRPWAPITDEAAEADAIAAGREAFAAGSPAGDFAERYDEVPALLAVAVDLRCLAAVDRDLDRFPVVGGASVYPFVWSILLAGRAEGLGGVVTTMPIRREPELAGVLGLPDGFALAAFVVLGHPVRQLTRLRRNPVEEFATIDGFGGRPLTG